MDTCNRNKKLTAKNIGVYAKVKCGKPIYKNGLCEHHYKRDLRVSTKWGERKNYAEATIEEMNSGRSMKLKDTSAHKLYRFRNDVIEQFHPEGYWIPTDIKPDHTLFCTKTL